MNNRIRVLIGLWQHWLPGVLCFSIFLSVFTTLAFDLQSERDTTLSWDGADWVTSSDKSAVLYFRRKFQISSVPKKAILKVAGTDNFELYINGILVEEKLEMSGTPFWLGSIQDGLNPGENVIAIRVLARTTQTRPSLLLSLMLEDAQGLQQKILSDGQWKVSRVPEFSTHENADWHQLMFSDTYWDQVITTRLLALPALHDNVSAENFLETKVAGIQSVWHEDLASGSALFTVDIAQPRTKFENAWLAVRCDGAFQLSLNERNLGSFTGDANQMKIINVFQQLTSTSRNQLGVYADCNKERSGVALMFIGQVGDGEFLAWPGSDWWVTPLSENGEPRPDASSHPLQVVKEGDASPQRQITLKQDFYSIEDEEISYRVTLGVRGLKWFLFWFGGFSVFMMALSIPKNCKENSLLAHNLVFLLATLAGVALSLLALDARILAADIFNFFVLSGVVVGCVLMQLAIFLEFRRSVVSSRAPVVASERVLP